jgi:predicted small metal-binding protein
MDCDCGHRVEGIDDEDLFRNARQHADMVHSDLNLSDDQLRGLVAERAQDA